MSIVTHPYESAIRVLLSRWGGFPDCERHIVHGPFSMDVAEDGSFVIFYDASMGLGPLAD